MSKTAYAFAVETLRADPDVRAVERCDECAGLGHVLTDLPHTWTGRLVFADPPVTDRCEACRGTGVSRIERYSNEYEPEFCYGRTRSRVLPAR